MERSSFPSLWRKKKPHSLVTVPNVRRTSGRRPLGFGLHAAGCSFVLLIFGWSLLSFDRHLVDLAVTSSSTVSSSFQNTSVLPSSCHKYKGILWIQQGDREGAAGTIFYLFVINQLLYAERHQLLPWIHFNNVSRYVYDPIVHAGGGVSSSYNKNNQRNAVVRHRMITAPSWDTTLVAGLGPDRCPAPPPVDDASAWRIQEFSIVGNGVWSSYFAPVGVELLGQQNDKQSILPECVRSLPVVTLTPDQILHGLHLQCSWSVRAWRYGGIHQEVRGPHSMSLHEWLEPQRQRAASIIQQYYHWQPSLASTIQALAAQWQANYQPCLGLHIRHSDKANRRRRIPVEEFIPYLKAYRTVVPRGHVYLATDSETVIETLKLFSSTSDESLFHVQPNVLRSSNTSAVFTLYQQNHDATNWQVLTDIGVLSRCTFLIHGLSAVSEAAVYHNLALHERSVNLEENPSHRISPRAFQDIVTRVIEEENIA